MKVLLENWRKLLEGDVIRGPWKEEPFEEPEEEIPQNALIANDIEDKIADHMNSVYANDWSNEQIDTFEQISELLNILFPSSK